MAARHVPLSVRTGARSRSSGPFEGVPPWLVDPLWAWAERQVRSCGTHRVQVGLWIDPPLYGMPDLEGRFRDDPGFALDVVDFLLGDQRLPGVELVGLAELLALGGSVWEVHASGDHLGLQQRTPPGVTEAVESVGSIAPRAYAHLEAARTAVLGRSPDASTGYREAVKAVEAAAKPVVLPDDPKATLGKMLPALRDKPEKWSTQPPASVELASAMAEALWTGQLDRHGTDDVDAPLRVSVAEAEAAFYLALPLVRWFAGGQIARRE